MSGAQTSSFGNVLFDPARAQAAVDTHQNQLLAQDVSRRAIDQDEVNYAGQIAGSILTLPQEQRAEAYAKIVGLEQTRGRLRDAPAQYPGDHVARALVARAMSPAELYKQTATEGAVDAYGNVIGIGRGATPGAAGGTVPSLAIPPRGTGGPGTGAEMPPEYLNYFREASAETGIPMDLLIAQARQESSFNPKARGAAGEIGLFQIKPSTAQQPGFGMTGVDPATLDDPRSNILFGARYLRGRMGQGDPNDPRVQSAGLAAYNGGGDPNYVANVNRYRPGLAPSDPAAQVTTYTPGGATQTAAGGPATPAPYQVAGQPVGPPGAAVAAPAATPAPAPAMPPELQTDEHNLTARDKQELAPLFEQARKSGNPAALTTFQNEVQQRQVANIARQDKWTAQQHQAQQDAAAAQERARVAAHQTLEEQRQAASDVTAAQLAAAGGNPARAVLVKLGPKIIDGTATEAERQIYELNYQEVTKSQPVQVPDPNDPSKIVYMMAPGQVPTYLPPPNYRPPSGSSASAGTGDQTASTWQPGQQPPPLQKPPAALTVEQAKAGNFVDQMYFAEDIMKNLAKEAQDWSEQRKQKLGDFIGFNANSPGYQNVRQAQDNWLVAKLRDESGAQIGDPEFERERRTFFPQPGDEAPLIEQKRQAREIAMAGKARAAGPQYKPPTRSEGPTIPQPKTEAEFNALRSGTVFIDPEGVRRMKP